MSEADAMYVNANTRNSEKRMQSDKPENQGTKKVYFSPFHGQRFVMPDGSVLQFFGGEYSTTNTWEQEELDRVIKLGSSVIFAYKVPMRVLQATILKDVGRTGGVGSFSSSHIAGNKVLSGR